MGEGSGSARADEDTTSGHSESGDVAPNSTSSSKSSAAAEASGAIEQPPRKRSRPQEGASTTGAPEVGAGMVGVGGTSATAITAAMLSSGTGAMGAVGEAGGESFLTVRKSILDAVVLQQHKRIVELEHSIQKTRYRIQRLRSSASAARAANAAAAAAAAAAGTTAAGTAAATSPHPGAVHAPQTPTMTGHQYRTPATTPHLPTLPVCPPATPTTPAMPEQQPAQRIHGGRPPQLHAHQQQQQLGLMHQLTMQQADTPQHQPQHFLPHGSPMPLSQPGQPPSSSPMSIAAPSLAPRIDPTQSAALAAAAAATSGTLQPVPQRPGVGAGPDRPQAEAEAGAIGASSTPVEEAGTARGPSSGAQGSTQQPAASQKQSRYWTQSEHERFLRACVMYGERNYAAIAQHVGSRTPKQVRTHAQKYAKRLQREESRRREAAAFVSMNRPEAAAALGVVPPAAIASGAIHPGALVQPARPEVPVQQIHSEAAGALQLQQIRSGMAQQPQAQERQTVAGGEMSARKNEDEDEGDDEEDEDDDDDEDDMEFLAAVSVLPETGAAPAPMDTSGPGTASSSTPQPTHPSESASVTRPMQISLPAVEPVSTLQPQQPPEQSKDQQQRQLQVPAGSGGVAESREPASMPGTLETPQAKEEARPLSQAQVAGTMQEKGEAEQSATGAGTAPQQSIALEEGAKSNPELASRQPQQQGSSVQPPGNGTEAKAEGSVQEAKGTEGEGAAGVSGEDASSEQQPKAASHK